jgi:hypothetical protein
MIPPRSPRLREISRGVAEDAEMITITGPADVCLQWKKAELEI